MEVATTTGATTANATTKAAAAAAAAAAITTLRPGGRPSRDPGGRPSRNPGRTGRTGRPEATRTRETNFQEQRARMKGRRKRSRRVQTNTGGSSLRQVPRRDTDLQSRIPKRCIIIVCEHVDIFIFLK